ncbi:hypothetical protein [Halomonas sp. C05BenzN]|uniref:hypothetical protein n=1 Tax=Halomonas sp. C05BenzN TaxID=3411041 RepID=UPI003B95F51F
MSKLIPMDYLSDLDSRTIFWGDDPETLGQVQPRTDHTIGLIGSRWLHRNLSTEVKVLRLTIDNYEAFIKGGCPDVLIVESAFSFSAGCWDGALNKTSYKHEIILEVLSLCKNLSIPTLFWDTQGIESSDYFSGISKSFDYVFFC